MLGGRRIVLPRLRGRSVTGEELTLPSFAYFGIDVPTACHISVPLLVQDLRSNGRHAEAEIIERAHPEMFGPGYSSRILLGSEVDTTDQTLSRLCSTLTTADLRQFSYPNVFYREIRSGLVHKYEMGSAATDWRMTETVAEVSCANMASSDEEVKRLTHFDMPWLTTLVLAIAKRVELSGATAPLTPPAVWWLREV